MIQRYSRLEMKEIWTDENKFRKWLQVECAVLKILENKRIIPIRISDKIGKTAKINVKRINKIEVKVKHDVIAFCTSISEQFGKNGRYFHYGLTSSDVVDSAFSLLIVESLSIIKKDLIEINKSIKEKSLKYKNTICIARTHGMHAEPSVFGLKFLSWYSEIKRRIAEIDTIINLISYGKISGAVGVYGILGPEIERKALNLLKLKPETVSTQILPRDRHLSVMQFLANIGNCLERISLEIRHLQRSEVSELEEGFSKGQKGSSAMPHKKNPISSENITGCSRILRGYLMSVSENTALWHERDISHSSVERVCFPDAFILCDYMIHRMNLVIENLNIKNENIKKNLDLTYGVTVSGTILNLLVKRGMKRENAYKIIQTHSLEALNRKVHLNTLLKKDLMLMKYLSKKDLDEIFNFKNRFKNVNQIYLRALK